MLTSIPPAGQSAVALTLDLDDTLWPIVPVMERCERALHEFLAANAPTVAERFPVLPMRALRDRIAAERPDLAHDYGALRRLSLEAAFRESALHAPATIDEAYAVYYATRNDVRLYDEVGEILPALARRHRLVAVTNGNADLERIGLRHLFHATVSARDLGWAKPDIRIFEHARDLLDVAGERIWHVGDDPLLDVIGARRAGLRTVWMNRDGRDWPFPDQPTPDLTVRDLAQLDQALTALAG